MAVTWVKETWHGRTGSLDDGFKREYRRTFLVRVDSIADGPAVVLVATGVPRIWDSYVTATDIDVGALCKKVTPHQTDTLRLWEVEAEYSSEIKEQSQQAQDPIARPSEIEWSFSKYQKAIDRDVEGRAIRNSAGLPFDPPPEVDESRVILVINRNEASFLPSRAYRYQDAVNSDAFFGADPGQFRVSNIRGRRSFENNFSFWAVTYEFEFRREGWLYRPMDRGKAELVAGVLKGVVDPAGLAASEPVPLDGGGRNLKRAQTTVGTAIDAGGLNLSVVDGSVFTAAVPFYVTVEDEDMKVTFVNLNTLAVTRGQNGTTAAAHAAGKSVKQAPVFLSFKVYKELEFADLILP